MQSSSEQQMSSYEQWRNNSKVCSKCHQRKLKSDFHKYAASKDGLKNQCKVCILPKATKRRAKVAELLARGTKICAKCGKETPLDGMSRSSGGIMGYGSYCKWCRAQQAKKYYMPVGKNRAQDGKLLETKDLQLANDPDCQPTANENQTNGDAKANEINTLQ